MQRYLILIPLLLAFSSCISRQATIRDFAKEREQFQQEEEAFRNLKSTQFGKNPFLGIEDLEYATVINAFPQCKITTNSSMTNPHNDLTDYAMSLSVNHNTFIYYYATGINRYLLQVLSIQDNSMPIKYGIAINDSATKITNIFGTNCITAPNSIKYNINFTYEAWLIFNIENDQIKEIKIEWFID